jgi:hypothetical protein
VSVCSISCLHGVLIIFSAPSAPATVVAIPYPPHTLEVLWTQPLRLNGLLRGYHLNCSAPDDESISTSITVGPDTHQYVITGLTANLVYSIQVAAISVDQGPSHFLTQALKTSSPSPPRQLKVITVTSSSVFLMWLPPSSPNGNISQYKIYYGLDGQEKEYYSIHSVPPNDPRNDVTIELSGLESGTTYVITVTASNNAEQPESGPSNLITTQTQFESRQDGDLTDTLTSDGVLAILITETCLLIMAIIVVAGFALWFCQQRKDMPLFDSASQFSFQPDSPSLVHPDPFIESSPRREEEAIV